MYICIKECFKEPMRGKIAGISGMENFYPLIDMENAQVIDMKYPEIDMQNISYPDNTFDYIISDQVLEHLEDPVKAIKESHRVLRKGGIAIHTTCFLNFIHKFPVDYWRFSPDALRLLCRDFDTIIQCEGWGNRIAVTLRMISGRFRYMQIPDFKWSIRRFIATWNEEKFPIVTWIIAKK